MAPCSCVQNWTMECVCDCWSFLRQIFSSSDWAISIAGQKLSVSVCVCLCVNHGGTIISATPRDLITHGDPDITLGIFPTHVSTWTFRAPKIVHIPSPPLDNIRVMVIVWRLRGNIQNCSVLVVWHSVYSQQHTQFLQVQQIGFVTLGPLRYS